MAIPTSTHPARRRHTRDPFGHHEAVEPLAARDGHPGPVGREAEGLSRQQVRVEPLKRLASSARILTRKEILDERAPDASLISTHEDYGSSVRHPSTAKSGSLNRKPNGGSIRNTDYP